MPPEVPSIQRQMMTTTTVGTIQDVITQMRASPCSRKRCLRMRAVAKAARVCSAALATTHTRLRPKASQKLSEPSILL